MKRFTFALGSASFLMGLFILIGYSQPNGEPVYWGVYATGLALFVLGAAQMSLSRSKYPLRQHLYAFAYMLVGTRHTRLCLPRTYYSLRRRAGRFAVFRWQYAEGLDMYKGIRDKGETR